MSAMTLSPATLCHVFKTLYNQDAGVKGGLCQKQSNFGSPDPFISLLNIAWLHVQLLLHICLEAEQNILILWH